MRNCPSDALNWRDLLVIVRHSGVESELYRSMHPDEAGWTRTNMLLAAAVDVLRWLQWAKTEDGQKGRNMPEPIPRPGVRGRKRPDAPAGKGVPRSRLRKLLGRDGVVPDRSSRLAALFAGENT